MPSEVNVALALRLGFQSTSCSPVMSKLIARDQQLGGEFRLEFHHR
jgi:hypothetical protein